MTTAADMMSRRSVLLGAGLKGIEEGYELPAAAEDDVWSLTAAERRAMGHDPLPASLHDAIRVMEESEGIRDRLQANLYEMLGERRSIWFG